MIPEIEGGGEGGTQWYRPGTSLTEQEEDP